MHGHYKDRRHNRCDAIREQSLPLQLFCCTTCSKNVKVITQINKDWLHLILSHKYKKKKKKNPPILTLKWPQPKLTTKSILGQWFFYPSFLAITLCTAKISHEKKCVPKLLTPTSTDTKYMLPLGSFLVDDLKIISLENDLQSGHSLVMHLTFWTS